MALPGVTRLIWDIAAPEHLNKWREGRGERRESKLTTSGAIVPHLLHPWTNSTQKSLTRIMCLFVPFKNVIVFILYSTVPSSRHTLSWWWEFPFCLRAEAAGLDIIGYANRLMTMCCTFTLTTVSRCDLINQIKMRSATKVEENQLRSKDYNTYI